MHATAWNAAEIAALRTHTPSTERTLHFDNAGASPMPDPVYRRMVDHLDLERELGGYVAKREVEAELAGFYDSVAALIGARPHQIAFTESATRAWDMAFYGIDFAPGDRILTSRTEYASSYLSFLQVAAQRGVRVEQIPDAPDGTIDVAALAMLLDDRVRLVNVCHVPTSNGLVNDAAAIGQVLRGHDALYVLDACQSVGQRRVDVREIGCDVLSATGRKFLRGPRGTGFLYVGDRALSRLSPPFVDVRAAEWVARDRYILRPDARRFEAWEAPVAAQLGLKCAADYAMALGLDRIEARVAALAAELRDALLQLPDAVLHDRGTVRSGIVTFALAGVDPERLQAVLDARRVAVSALTLGDALLDLEPAGHAGVLRASVHYFNTSDEIGRFVEAVDHARRSLA